MNNLEIRLSNLEEALKSSEFRLNKGKANEVNYHVFDYEPKDELLVRERLLYLKNKYKESSYDFNLKIFDLYDIIIDLLIKEGFLDLCDNFEKRKGLHEITKAVNEMLQMSEDTMSNELLKHIKERVDINSIVLICGVGKCFPFLRSHKILNNLHQFIDNIPVVMFFPGKYDGGSLVLFSEIKDDNYYRAFRFE